MCHLGGLLGSALFGNPDLQRTRLFIDWVEAGWTFAGVFAVGSAAAAAIIRVPFREMLGLSAGARRESADEAPRPWLRGVGWGFAAFLLVSSGRLVFLNVFTTPTRRPKVQFTDAERTALLQEFAVRSPAWQRIADPGLMANRRSWQRRAIVEFGAIEREVYHFPANVGFQDPSHRFAPRPYAHTGFYFRGAGPSLARIVWADFAGDIPPSLRATPCLLIGLARFRAAPAAYLEHSIEAIAIIPAPGYQPDMTQALVAPVFPETQALLEAPAPPQ